MNRKRNNLQGQVVGLEAEKNHLVNENERLKDMVLDLKSQLQQKENIIKEVREKVDNLDVFKEFTFPLMKRDEEQQVKSSIDYEWRKSIKEPILEILDKVDKN